MMRGAKVIHTPDFVTDEPGQFFTVSNQEPFVCEGVLFGPAETMTVAAQVDPRTGTAVSKVMLGCGKVGLAWSMTPDGARSLAECLLRSAAKVEEVTAEKAASAIDAARASGGRA